MAQLRVGERLYDMDPTTWPNVDVSSVQRALGYGLQKFMDAIEAMDVDAIQALIWVLRRRDEPGLRIDDVTFTIREFMDSMEISDGDVRAAWPRLDALQREEMLSQLSDEQRARLFTDGELIEETPAPLVPADQDAATEI